MCTHRCTVCTSHKNIKSTNFWKCKKSNYWIVRQLYNQYYYVITNYGCQCIGQNVHLSKNRSLKIFVLKKRKKYILTFYMFFKIISHGYCAQNFGPILAVLQRWHCKFAHLMGGRTSGYSTMNTLWNIFLLILKKLFC